MFSLIDYFCKLCIKKNLFQASLIMMGIVILLYIVFGIIIFSLLANNSVRY